MQEKESVEKGVEKVWTQMQDNAYVRMQKNWEEFAISILSVR
jgi:hypothetical protein